jgi:maleylpyruvate isomerase
MLQLYDYPRSSAAFRVRLALNYKGLDYTAIKVDLITGAQRKDPYLKINPAGLVPALIAEDSQVVPQSLAIIEYVEACYPQPPLLPGAIAKAAYVRAIAFTIAGDIHPLNNLRVLNYLRHEMGQDEGRINKWYQHWIQLGLGSLELMISKSKFYSGTFACDEHFSLADLCLLPQLYNARRFKCDLSNYPTLVAIDAYCRQFDWVNQAYPDFMASANQ